MEKEEVGLVNQTTPENLKWYHININILPMKATYFLLGFIFSTHRPYVNLFLTDIGLSKSQAGFIAGMRFIGAILGSTLLAMLTDWSQRRKLVLFLVVFGVISTMIPQPFLPYIVTKSYKENSSIVLCNQTENLLVSPEDSDNVCDAEIMNILFFLFLIMYLLVAFFDSYFAIFIDSNAMLYISSSKKKINLGRQRLFSPMGFATASLLMGAALKLIPGTSILSRYSMQQFMYSITLVIYLVCGYWVLCKTEKLSQKHGSTSLPKPKLFKPLKKALLQIHVAFLLVTLLLIGLMDGLHLSFVLVLLREKNPPDILFGFLFVAQNISSITVYFTGEYFMKLVKGKFPALALAQLAHFFRFVTYGFTSSPYAFIAIQAVNGIARPLMILAAIKLTHEFSPKEVTTTMIAISTSLINSAGPMVANIFGGFIYQAYGGHTMYKIAALIAGCWCAITLLYILFYERNRKKVLREELELVTSAQMTTVSLEHQIS